MLPAGIGKEIRIAVFADKDFEQDIKDAGADIIGNEALIKQIGEGIINFDKLIATHEQMNTLKPLARILGPKGLMPNVKSGTLVKADHLIEAVRVSKQGMVEFRVNEHSDILLKIGLKEFEEDDIFSNFDALAKAIALKRPESIKGIIFSLFVNACLNYKEIFLERIHQNINGPISEGGLVLVRSDRIVIIFPPLPI